jgi:sulfatase maturation enzyme AslB (radical SAM superfamily)
LIDPQLAAIAATLRDLPFPRKFAVEVCADCNLTCAMCHQPSMRRAKGRMPLRLWQKCADEIARVSPGTECWFSFCGEPLLEPDLLLAMLAYGRKVGLGSLNVNTNGVLLTPEIAERLLASGVALIVIGIDGFSRETYERLRVGGDRDRVYANVEHLLRARAARGGGPEVQVQFIEMKENAAEFEPFGRYWLERGATIKLRKMLSWGGRLETPLSVPPESRIPCPWAVTMMHVFWDGRVPRCPGDTEGDESAGSAWDESLAVLWRRLGAYREKHLQHRFDELPDRCLRCKDWMTGAADRIRPRALPVRT